MNKDALPELRIQLNQALETVPEEIRRLFHGRGMMWPGLEQLTVDWIDRQLVVSLFKPVEADFLIQLKALLMDLSLSVVWQQRHGRAILIQHRYEHGAPTEILCGEACTDPVVTEDGLKYQLALLKNQNFGLFLDMRIGRQWVRLHAENANVLNLFAYTCGFSVAALAGGAQQVVNVDMSGSSLNRGRDNHRLNGHDVSQVKFLAHDIFKSWGKIKKSGPYDLVIIDPPSFQKGSFALTKDYKRILRRLPELLANEGEVLACVNSPAVSPDFLVESMREEVPQLHFVERLPNPPEFEEADASRGLKVMRFTEK